MYKKFMLKIGCKIGIVNYYIDVSKNMISTATRCRFCSLNLFGSKCNIFVDTKVVLFV